GHVTGVQTCALPIFNNAGIQSPAVEMADVPGEEFDRVNGINLRGVWNCMKYELRQMREQGSGAIVNNSSIGGLIGIAGRATYHEIGRASWRERVKIP